jgi:ribosomal protein L3 glutamine methyltransferase
MINKREIANDLATIRDMIRWGTSQFNAAGLCFAQGMPQAIDEAVYLCLSALHLPPDFSVEYFDCVLTMEERLNVLGLYQQRIETKKPAAYITHEAWFCGMSFYVDERVLIPRSPIAEIIAGQFSPWLDTNDVHHILDLCTGSGCIALACAEYFPHASVDASDISADALAVAEINRQNHALEDRVTLIQSDLFNSIVNTQYDIIVSNPPYVANAEVEALPEEFQHEPGELALAAGADGMDIVRRILANARQYLSDHGILVVEVGYSKPALEALYPDVPFLWVDFEFGGEGVFVMSANELDHYRQFFME